MKICSLENCNGKHKGLGFCEKHYRRFKLYGNVNFVNPKSQKDLTIAERFWSKVKYSEGCWIWLTYTDKDGYGNFRIRIPEKFFPKQTTIGAHIVSFILTFNRLPKDCVLHRCDNPSCVKPSHLFEGTKKDNMQDCISKNRLNPRKGENHPKTILTMVKVLYIRKELKKDKSMINRRKLAKELQVSVNAINNIYYGHNWKHI